ncbi:protein cordon-bleu isoform X2 [Lepisosteus oculatus]|uniref:protein cordon-bleu isoform X2 n=1 Tax=Lepisosteus oculatus TaxID=7918 RepID=UPI0035F51CF8
MYPQKASVPRKMKARAPPPPQAPQPAPRRIFNTAKPTSLETTGPPAGEAKENVLHYAVDLLVTLPQGFQTRTTVSGSKALMDLLVDLCSQYHLNPVYHTLELLSSDAQPVPFKPNTLLGTLDVDKVLIKEKVIEEKVRRPPPKVPEKTVRLVVNYHRTQKAVVRVNPLVPLETLISVICEKCEFDPRHVILLKDNTSSKELDLSQSISDLGIRELYVLDQSRVLHSKMHSAPVLNYAEPTRSSSLSNSASERKSLLGFIKFNRRKTKTEDQRLADLDSTDDKNIQNCEIDHGVSSTAPNTPSVNVRPSRLGQSQSVSNISRMSPRPELKKRRAPRPPQEGSALPQAGPGPQEAEQVAPGSPSSNQQKKRKAPAPPATPALSTKTGDSAPVVSSSRGEPEGADPASCSRTNEPQPVENSTAEESASVPNHKAEEVDDNRQSTMGARRQVPLKPRRGNVRDPPQLEIPPPPPYPPPCLDKGCADSDTPQPSDVALEHCMELAPESWLRSMQESCLLQKMGTQPRGLAGLEEETVSMGSSSSFPDDACTASEGTAEDSGIVSSPSDVVHPASPEGSLRMGWQLSQGQCSGSTEASCCAAPEYSASDSEEGVPAWRSHSRHSSDFDPNQTTAGIKCDQYDEDLDLTAQLHQTLADLDADLADVEHTDLTSKSSTYSMDKVGFTYPCEIPVSDVDMAVPVTTIDEVYEDYRCSVTNYEIVSSQTEETINGKYASSFKISSELENKNNNAVTAAVQSPRDHDNLKSIKQSSSSYYTEEKCCTVPVTEIQFGTQRDNDFPTDRINSQIQKIKTDNEETPKLQSVNQYEPRESHGNSESLASTRRQITQSKIPQSCASRVGMKTFTVVPLKPALSQNQKPGGSLVIGAIKIDAQGNLIKPDDSENRNNGSLCSSNDSEESLLRRAKAFWSSAEQHESDNTSRRALTKTRDLGDYDSPLAEPVQRQKLATEAKSVNNAVKEEVSTGIPHSKPGGKNKLLTPELMQQSLKPMLKTEVKNDLSFLKPSRRTSSQYVASAIVKSAIRMPTAKGGSCNDELELTQGRITIPDSKACKSSSPVKLVFPNENRYTYPETNYTKHTHISAEISKTKETKSDILALTPIQSQSFSNHKVSQYQLNKTAFEQSVSVEEKNNASGNSNLYNEKSAVSDEEIAKTRLTESQACNSCVLQKSYRTLQLQNDASRLESSFIRPIHNPLIKQTVKEDISELTEGDSQPPPAEFNNLTNVNIFGPVRKFKPVTLKSIQIETSLHSTLMEAIQSGDGKERLRKITATTGETTQKKPSFVEAENERAALLAAIRAQSNSSRLRKTKSTAAEELGNIRKAEEGNGGPSTEAVLRPPHAPPPPPAGMLKARPSGSVLRSRGSPEQARAALLEAIRSGSGAAHLKKVPVLSKTVLVNARLGKVQAQLVHKD